MRNAMISANSTKAPLVGVIAIIEIKSLISPSSARISLPTKWQEPRPPEIYETARMGGTGCALLQCALTRDGDFVHEDDETGR